MRKNCRLRMKSLLLWLVVFALAFLAPGETSVLAGETDKAPSSVSPTHARLIRLLEANKAAAADKPVWSISGIKILKRNVSSLPGWDREVKEQEKDGNAAGPERVYMAPGPQDRQLILEGLSRILRTRTVSPDGADLPFLQELNRLAAKAGGRPPFSALDSEKPPEANKTENEPNDSWAEAQALEYGDVVDCSALPEKDIDIYSFEGKTGDFVRIEALPHGLTGWTTAVLFDPDSNLVTGGFYGLKEYPGSPEDSRLAPIIWPGGNIVATTLETEGTYYIVVSTLPGDIIFLDSQANGLDTGESSGEVSYILKLENLPTLPVSGNVIDDRGLAVAGAGLHFWSYDGLGGVQSSSGEDGSFSLVLPQGTYSVAVVSPPASRYPDGQIVERFTVEGSGAELQFVFKTGVIFSGRTIDDRGDVVGNVGFSLIDRDHEQYRWGYSAQEGTFSVAVFPGTYDIHIHAPYQYPPQPVIRGVKIEKDTSYDLILDTGNRVSGNVLGPEGSPLARVHLNFYSEKDSRRAVSDENGAYQIALAEGEYWIVVRPDSDILLPEQQVGPLEVNEDLVYDIRLAEGGVLSGSVIDSRGNEVPNTQINLRPTYTDPNPVEPGDTIKTDDRIIYVDQNGDLVESADVVSSDLGATSKPFYWNSAKRTWTDREGNWRIALIPGEYTAEVVAPADYPPQSVRAGTFTVEEGVSVQVPQVRIDCGVKFSGRVFLPDGSPLKYGAFFIEPALANSEEVTYADRDAIIAPSGIARWGNWVYLDEHGAFELRVLAGVYDLYFYQKTGDPGSPRQRVEGVNLESDLDLTINLQPGHLLSGRVTDPDGNGIEGSYINFYTNDGIWHGSAASGRDGAFSIRLIAGDYIAAVSPVRGFFPDSASLAVTLAGDQTLDVVLHPGVRVYGRVTDNAGRGLGDVMVHLVPHYDTGQDSVIWFLPLDPTIFEEPVKKEPAGDVIQAVGSDIGLVLLPPDRILPVQGAYDFYAWTDDSGYWEVVVKANVYDIYAYSIRSGYNKIFVSAVDCTREKEINLTLEEAEIVVNGRVEDEEGRPVSGALVSLLDPDTGSHVSSYTNESGEFELELAKGTYEIYVSNGEFSGKSGVTALVEIDSNRDLNVRLGEGLLDEYGEKVLLRGLYKAYLLGGNYPNPFNPSTTISYTVDQPSDIRLTVFTIRGRCVVTLVDRLHAPGIYHIQWDGTDSSGRPLASGVYFYRMEAGDYSVIRKMVLLK